MGNNDGKSSTASGEGSTVSTKSFDVADNGSLRNLVEWQDVSDTQGSLLSAVNKLTSVHTLGTKEKFSIPLITVGIQKLNLGNGSTSTRVVDNVLDNSANVSLLFSIIQGTKFDSSLAGPDMCLEDGRLTLTLCLFFHSTKNKVSSQQINSIDPNFRQ